MGCYFDSPVAKKTIAHGRNFYANLSTVNAQVVSSGRRNEIVVEARIVYSPVDDAMALEALNRLAGSQVVLFSTSAVPALLVGLVGIDTSQAELLIYNGDHVPTSQILRLS